MPLTQLDPSAALIVIDLQKGIVGMEGAHPTNQIVANAAALAAAFRQRKLPVVLVNVAGMAPGRTDAARPKLAFPADWTELAPELDAQPTDIRITKHSWGAFGNSSLHDELRRRNVTQVFFAGISTSIGVESSARSAYDLGYNIVFVTDAMTDREMEAHRFSVEKIFPRMGELETTENVLQRLTRSQGKE